MVPTNKAGSSLDGSRIVAGKILRLSAKPGDVCGAAVPAAQKLVVRQGRRDARTTNLTESRQFAQSAKLEAELAAHVGYVPDSGRPSR